MRVSVCETDDRLAEADGCVSLPRKIHTLRVQVESWFAFSLLDKVYAEHSVFEVVGGHSWRACSCVVKQ